MATVTRENIGLLNDKIVVNVKKEDYLPTFEKALKSYGKKASLPGFRKGMVPPSVIKKMYGSSVLTDEVLKTVEKELTKYMVDEKLDIFAQPLPLAENDARNISAENPADYVFAFEVGLKPEFPLADFSSAKVHSYQVKVTDEMIENEVNRLRLRHGKMEDHETVTSEDNVLNVNFIETDEAGNEVNGGIQKDNSLLLKYFSPAAREQWMGKKAGEQLTLQLNSAFDDREKEWVLQDLGLSKDDATAGRKFLKSSSPRLDWWLKQILMRNSSKLHIRQQRSSLRKKCATRSARKWNNIGSVSRATCCNMKCIIFSLTRLKLNSRRPF